TRIEVLQQCRMAKSLDLLDRWNRRELNMAEAGEVLGISERQFRRYRDRFEQEGLEGLVDRRLGKASARRVPLAGEARAPALYRARYEGWNVKHCQDHLRATTDFRFGYTRLKLRLQGAGLVSRARKHGAHRRKRERRFPSPAPASGHGPRVLARMLCVLGM
ncbi:MAG: helix-turn-helix domain-containing protein, partial [Rhodobacter sp.]|nr:helix-turn-helix domain-containing protein [Rhodobacter sp.]